jgi:hypothetical protein
LARSRWGYGRWGYGRWGYGRRLCLLRLTRNQLGLFATSLFSRQS